MNPLRSMRIGSASLFFILRRSQRTAMRVLCEARRLAGSDNEWGIVLFEITSLKSNEKGTRIKRLFSSVRKGNSRGCFEGATKKQLKKRPFCYMRKRSIRSCNKKSN
jgi:hypothetical protein